MLYGERIRVGLVGIPSSGKTTIFNLLCKASAEVSEYPFTTKSKNQGIMQMYEPRVEVLSKILKSNEVKYPAVEIVDVAGLIKGAHKGEGLGNEFLSYIRPLDIVCYVLRHIESVPHIDGKDDIKRDFDILRYEISMSDLEIISRREEKLKKLSSVGQKEARETLKILEKIKEQIENFAQNAKFKVEWESEDERAKGEKEISSLNLISAKPFFVIINTDISTSRWDELKNSLKGKIEDEKIIVCDALSEMEIDEKEVRNYGITPLRELITNTIKKIGNVVIFFTGFEGKEMRSWIVQKGTTVFEAAGMIHSDMQKGFISAEVAKYEEYKKFTSDKEAYQNGVFIKVGKDYIIEDGDIIRIKFKV